MIGYADTYYNYLTGTFMTHCQGCCAYEIFEGPRRGFDQPDVFQHSCITSFDYILLSALCYKQKRIYQLREKLPVVIL